MLHTLHSFSPSIHSVTSLVCLLPCWYTWLAHPRSLSFLPCAVCCLWTSSLHCIQEGDDANEPLHTHIYKTEGEGETSSPLPITCFSMHTVDDSYLLSLPFPSLLFVCGRVLVIPLSRIPPTHFLSLTVLIRLWQRVVLPSSLFRCLHSFSELSPFHWSEWSPFFLQVFVTDVWLEEVKYGKKMNSERGKEGRREGWWWQWALPWMSIYRRRLQEALNTSPRDEANLEITKFGNKNITNGEEGRGSHMGYRHSWNDCGDWKEEINEQ